MSTENACIVGLKEFLEPNRVEKSQLESHAIQLREHCLAQIDDHLTHLMHSEGTEKAKVDLYGLIMKFAVSSEESQASLITLFNQEIVQRFISSDSHYKKIVSEFVGEMELATDSLARFFAVASKTIESLSDQQSENIEELKLKIPFLLNELYSFVPFADAEILNQIKSQFIKNSIDSGNLDFSQYSNNVFRMNAAHFINLLNIGIESICRNQSLYDFSLGCDERDFNYYLDSNSFPEIINCLGEVREVLMTECNPQITMQH